MDIDTIRAACTETLVIGLLRDGPKHGYEIGKLIERRSAGYFAFKHSTLYPVLHRLEQKGIVRGHWTRADGGRPQKEYRLTETGHRYCAASAAKWREFIAAVSLLAPEVLP